MTETEKKPVEKPTTTENRGLEKRLKAAWQRESRYHLLHGLSMAWPGAVGLLLVDFLLDWKLDLPGWLRWLLLLANAGALGWILWTRYGQRVQRFNSTFVALRVEKTIPNINSLLVSAMQLDETDVNSSASPFMIQAVKRQAAEKTAQVDFGQIVNFRNLRPWAMASGVALVVLLACVGFKPGYFFTLARRMVNPWSTAAYPTRTHIEVLSGDVIARISEPIQLEARASGVIPDMGTLRVRFGITGWESVDLIRHGTNEFHHTFEQAPGDFDYRFKLGDAYSHVYHVSVVRPPQVTSASVKLEYPPHTHLPAEETQVLNLKVPEKTKITWQVTTDRAVTKADLVFENKDPLPAMLSSDRRTITVTTLAESSSSYRFRYGWKIFLRACNDDGPAHFLRVLPDQDPRVELTYPVEDEKATTNKLLTLSFHAHDDYGLEQATIVYAINDRAEQRRPPEKLDGKTEATRDLTWALKKDLPELNEGDILTVAVELSNSAGRVAKSKSRRVQFVSSRDYLEYAINRQRKYLGQIRPLYLQERDAATRMRDMETAGGAKTNKD